MQGIAEKLQSLINGIMLGVNFLMNIIKGIMQLFQLLASTILNTMTLIATLPSWLIAIATATLGVCILYMIIGRDTGK